MVTPGFPLEYQSLINQTVMRIMAMINRKIQYCPDVATHSPKSDVKRNEGQQRRMNSLNTVRKMVKDGNY